MDQATFERVQRPICDMRLTLKAKKEAYSKKKRKVPVVTLGRLQVCAYSIYLPYLLF